MKRGIRVSRIFAAAAVACVLAPTAARAQSAALKRGGFMVAGSANFTSTGRDNSDSRSTSVSLSPDLLYFVRRGIAVGGSATFGRSTQDDARILSYSVGPKAAFFFGDDDKIHPFLSAEAGLGTTGVKGDLPIPYERHTNVTHVGASAGVLALIEPHVGFHGQLFYSRDSFSRDSGGYSDAVGVAFGFDIFLGG